MKYAVGDITNIAADVTVRSNSVSSGSTVSMIFLDLNANDSDGYYVRSISRLTVKPARSCNMMVNV